MSKPCRPVLPGLIPPTAINNYKQGLNLMKTKPITKGWWTLVVFVASLSALNASAIELQFDNPELSGFVDTTISASVALTTTNGIERFSPASGRLNVFQDAGEIYSAPLSFITDAGVRWGDWGVFTRFGYLYDFEIMDGSNKCTNCSGRTPGSFLDGIPEGSRNEYNAFTLYDLFVYGDLDLGGHLTSVRVGKQVVNWGESNIMGGGISSAINPEDLGKRTTPGTEVKERLLPQEMVYFNFGLSEYTSLEAYYIWNWRRTEFVPVGTYFSPFDFLGPGFNPDLQVPGVEERDADKPKRGGQWGVAVHHIFPSLNDMDLGLYWVRSHASNPYLQANFDPAGPGVIPGLFTTYHEVFSEDQDTYAISLSGEVFETGIAFQTEVNFREDFWDTRECMNFFGLAGILGAIGAAPFPTSWTPVYPDTGGVPGCENEDNDIYTWLGSLLMSGAGHFGSDSHAYIFDWQMQWVDGQSHGDLTDRTPALASDAARLGLKTPGVDQLDRLVTDFSWGYTFVAAYTYNDVFWDINVKPTFVWVHHVEGYQPFNSGALVENQRTVSVGVTFEYQNNMSLDVAHVWWPGREGTWSDRDNVSVTFKYSF